MKFIKFLFVGFLSLFLPVGSSYAKLSDGTSVATALNERFANVVSDCDGNPAFYCSGIILRTNETNFSYPTWQPWWPNFTKESLQFSYLRKDLGVNANTPFEYKVTGFGIIIMRDNDTLATRCIFPMDGATTYRDQFGCGELISSNVEGDVDNSSCKSHGVETAEQWASQGNGCSFSTHDTKQFSESLKTTKTLNTYNEMVVNTSDSFWSSEAPSKDHIQALWYNPDADSSTDPANKKGLNGAQAEQQLYFDKTGEWVPIVSYNVSDEKQLFSYSDEDQKVLPSSE